MAAAKKPNIVFALWKIPVGGARIAIALAAAVVLTGCASASVATIPPVTAEVACETPVPERNLLLGVALSGGRSRAALFGTAGLEALAGVRTADGASLIEKISHLSSVSGGSLAASYYVLKKPGRDVKVLAPGDTLSTPYRAFFDKYRADLSQDFETSLIWRQLLSFRWLKQLQTKRAKRALIVAFDSSFPFSVGERRLSLRSLPFTILTFDFSRIPSIMEERASTYQALFFRSLQLEGVVPDVRTISVIALRHTEAKWAADLSDLPPACKAEPDPLKTPAEIRERIAEIPTRLLIASECDRELLTTAAAKLVAEYRGQILEFIDRP